MNIVWFYTYRFTYNSKFGIITRLSISSHCWCLALIIHYTIWQSHPNYFNLACIFLCYHKFLYDRHLLLRFLFYARRSDGMWHRMQAIKHSWTTAPSWRLPVTLCHLSTLVHLAGSISMVQSLKQAKSTAVVGSTCFSLGQSPERPPSTKTSFLSCCTPFSILTHLHYFSTVTWYLSVCFQQSWSTPR